MRIVCVIATHGEDRWLQLASSRPLPSTAGQGFDDVVLTHLPEGTLADARNEGARVATVDHRADMLVFLDADDELAPGYVDAMRAAMGDWHPSIGFDPRLYSPAVQYVRHGNRRTQPKLWPRMAIEDGNWMVIGTAVPAELFESVGGFKEWPMYEDWCLWQRCMKAGAMCVDVPDAVYVAHATNLSRNRAPNARDRLRTHHAIRQANYPELYEEATT